METTGEKIRYWRKKKNLTQETIAQELNLSQRAYSKIENNEVMLKIDRLEEIARILNVKASELLPGGRLQHFEKVSYSQIGNGNVHNQHSEKEQNLYEKIIQQQKDEIEYLKGLINVLRPS